MTTSLQQPPLKTEDLLIGMLAVLSLRGRDSVKTTDKAFHSAFGNALEVFKSDDSEIAKVADEYYPDIVSNTYDELNNALIVAEGYSLLRFPNPSYTRLQITMTPRVATTFLNGYGEKKELFEKAADALLKGLAV
ncbi:MAG TPA: hypothetical protein VFD22_10455 [Gemmatimonadaceae bacterium]|nr:hypothetical protein [Gemmatimonadaceae bacterium]